MTKPTQDSPIFNEEDFTTGKVFGTPVYGLTDCQIQNYLDACQAQAQRIAEWGDKPCPHVEPEYMGGVEIATNIPRRCCDKCWQELKQGGK